MTGLSAEKMFLEAVMDAKRLIKRKPCNRIPPRHRELRFLEMTPTEVLKKLEQYGIKISRSTLLNYERDGLIPKPERGGLGQGKGRTTNYPDNTVAELVASRNQIYEGWKLSPSKAGEIRQRALALEADPKEWGGWDLQKIIKRYKIPGEMLVDQWVYDKAKIEHGIPLSDKITIFYTAMKDGTITKEVRKNSSNSDSMAFNTKI